MESISFIKNLCNTFVFHLDPYGNLLNTVTPVILQMLDCYHNQFSHVENIQYFSQHAQPIIYCDDLNFFWTVVPEYIDEEITSLYVIGPATDIIRLESELRITGVSHALAEALSKIRVTSFYMIYNIAEALYETLNKHHATAVNLDNSKLPSLTEIETLYYATTPGVTRILDFEEY